MAISAKVVLRKKSNEAGLFPLAIRITKNRSSTYKYIGEYIPLEDWDKINRLVKSSNHDFKNINGLIKSELKKVKKRLKSLNKKDSDSNVYKIKAKLYSRTINDSFFELSKEHLDELKASKNYGRLSTDSGLISNIRKYNKSEYLSFKDIDKRFLKKLKIFLKEDISISETSIMNHYILIRLLYNRAINDKMVKRKFYPFGKGKIQIKFPETQKIGLNKEEIKNLEQLNGLTYEEQNARNAWFFSFNFAGIRASDVLHTRWSDFQNGRLYYTMGKNNKVLSLKVPDKIKEILKFYENEKRNSNDFIFPDLKRANLDNPKDVYNKIKTANRRWNCNLKKLAKKAGIDKSLTMHIARHSFGHIAGEKIHPKKLQKLYRHTDLKTTINYQANFIHAEADEALDSVVNF